MLALEICLQDRQIILRKKIMFFRIMTTTLNRRRLSRVGFKCKHTSNTPETLMVTQTASQPLSTGFKLG